MHSYLVGSFMSAHAMKYYITYIFIQDIDNVLLSLQSSMISEEGMVQPTHQHIKLNYSKPCYYCQHKVLLFPNESQPPFAAFMK